MICVRSQANKKICDRTFLSEMDSCDSRLHDVRVAGRCAAADGWGCRELQFEYWAQRRAAAVRPGPEVGVSKGPPAGGARVNKHVDSAFMRVNKTQRAHISGSPRSSQNKITTRQNITVMTLPFSPAV